MRSGRAATLACAIVLGSACGGSDKGSGSSDVAFSDLPAKIAATYCAAIQQCFGTYLQIVPQPDCQTNLQHQFQNATFDAIQAALDAKAVSYDAHKAGSCISALSALGCDIFDQRLPPICDEALSGSVPLGSPCSIGAECAGDAFCDLAQSTCPGACSSRRASGQACTSDDACQSGLVCQSGTCTAPALAGEPCGAGSAADCRAGLVCLGETTSVPGTCAEAATVTSGKLGTACDPTQQKLCTPDLACVLDTPVSVPVTFTCRTKSAAGASCTLGLPEPCPDGQYCNADITAPSAGVCSPMPSAGQACLTGTFRVASCAAGLVCVANVCTARQDNGASCSDAGACYGGSCTNGVCAGDQFCTN